MRRVLIGAGVLVLCAVVALGAGGWYYADQLLPAVEPGEPSMFVRVDAVDGTMITLVPDPDAPEHELDDLTGDHVVGFRHPGGYVQLSGAAAVEGNGTTTRSFEVIAGTVPAAGDRGDVQANAYPNEPTVLGLPVDEVTAPGPLGDMTGWRFATEGPHADRWVVLVHGRGATRAEALRAVDVVVRRAGWSALVITYRNGEAAPRSPDGFGHYGDTEWRDLQAWLRWLDDAETPQEVNLFGFSQGGSLVAGCLRWCEDVPPVTATVLDSPLLSMQATLELQAEDRGIPSPVIGPLLTATKAVSTVRGGPDFANLEHVDRLAEMDLPILVIHGREDTTVPFGPAEQLRFRDNEQVQLLPYDGDHVRGWNHEPRQYREAVATFLARP